MDNPILYSYFGLSDKYMPLNTEEICVKPCTTVYTMPTEKYTITVKYELKFNRVHSIWQDTKSRESPRPAMNAVVHSPR